jgi:hypothetical protein
MITSILHGCITVHIIEQEMKFHDNGEMITKKLNEVYEKVNQDEFARDLDVGLESLRNLTKNDAW